jgi:hypothetical protein
MTTQVLALAHPDRHSAERRWIAEVLLKEFLGLDFVLVARPDLEGEIVIGDDASSGRLTLRDVLFRMPEDGLLTAAALPQIPLDRWDISETPIGATLVDPSLPVLYGNRLENGSYYSESSEGIELGIDVFGSAFFMLSRLEELVKPDRDSYERFPATASLAYLEGFLDRPIVNEYLEILWWALNRLWPGLVRKDRSFRRLISHDVDHPRRSEASRLALARSSIGDVIKRKDAGLARRRLRGYRAARRGDWTNDIFNTFDWIMAASERQGLRDAFYFIADRGAGEIECSYSIDEPWIGRLLREIHERGHEIGLHPSFGTLHDEERTRRELERLLSACDREGIVQDSWGARQHYLRWENPFTWRSYESMGLVYDSSLTFAERPGFRCGVCYEYSVFDLVSRRPLRLRERPLIVMDGSLLGYQRLSPARAADRIALLRERCRLFRGDFTLLWHNSMLLERGVRRLYARAIGEH